MTNNAPTFFSRRQVAVLLGTSEDEVKEKDSTAFHPTKGPDGSWRYAADQVISVLSEDDEGSSDSPTGAICALAFELFQQGKDLPTVVISSKQSPTMVRALRAEYDAMVGSLTIPSETMSLIRKLSRKAVGSASDILELIDSLRAERDTAYEQGLADASDAGEVLDPQTDKMISVGSLIARPPK